MRLFVRQSSVMILLFLTVSFSACSSGFSTNTGKIPIVVAENFWGSLVSQIGGQYVDVHSIVNSPTVDPHDYSATTADARALDSARYAILNGAGYDTWFDKILQANPSTSRTVLNIGNLVHRKAGDNPHIWYSPAAVNTVINQMAHDLSAIDPSHAAYYQQQQTQLLQTGLAQYTALIASIKTTYANTSIGSTESIFIDMAQALDLNLITPVAYMRAISEGIEPIAADKAIFQQQITNKNIAILVYNRQNSTPEVQGLILMAQHSGIPVVSITETPDPATLSFQDWQVAQLQHIQQALAQAKQK